MVRVTTEMNLKWYITQTSRMIIFFWYLISRKKKPRKQSSSPFSMVGTTTQVAFQTTIRANKFFGNRGFDDAGIIIPDSAFFHESVSQVF